MIGRTLEGYRIEAELGRGGQAVVYRATQLALQRQVALKVVSQQLSADPSFMERFKREGIAAASLDHPHVIPVYEAGEADGMAFLAMKFVDGPSLDDLIRTPPGIDARRCMSILHQAAEALDYAHSKGLVHRDVKPANILIGAGDHAYLSDFGLTRAMDGSRLTSSGVWMGTLEYVAPEQIRGAEVTSAADRYALAIVAYEALTGKTVFDQTDRTALLYAHMHETPVAPSKRRQELGRQVDRVFQRALSKKPDERPATSVALVEELATAVGAQGITGPPGRPAPPPSPPGGSRRPTPGRGSAVPPPPPSPPAGSRNAASLPPQNAGGGGPNRGVMIGAGVLAAIALVVGIMFASGVFKNERVVTRTTTVTVP
ncbi:MAG: serine/threonine protein kinase [Thermoleophilia bacterium]|nr:serine/threonine protein kinase [Thermoleophilia bacterium]